MELLFPSAFLALALAHFVALLSPGPDFFLLVGYAARYRLRGSAGLCLGIAAGNGLYILLVIIGWSALRQFGWLFTLIELSGALYLLWIGSHLVRNRPQPLALEEPRQCCPSLRTQILLGLGSALLNPKNALFYLALMTALLGPDVTLLQQATCGVWMVMVVLVWDLALISLMGLPAVQRKLSRSLWLIERTAGVVLMGFGGWVLWRFLHFSPVSLYP
ncbi:LysE family translocator [Enterobacter hormaechei]|uniref:LysE family translocator n=1 Tax=Enterobacter hormaechei TaxID=158836 RepID=UPI000791C7B6|nr:LysE family translocator [Enterobacter hormaechei]ELC6295412.1 LysE family translocator [Enterobacter hormaechei]ELC6541164.1 LysE family translocator [Enterobacter hormaechei]MBG0545294.1 LysE family translocator [Enterobacter hormaechei]MCM7630191.1 LysE family translocator [Enterobacter hormaechei]MCM7777833.1 LysE family translocator [Enterobacter hormaechei]